MGAPFALEQHALEGVLPQENMQEAGASTPGVNLANGTVVSVQDIIQLRAIFCSGCS